MNPFKPQHNFVVFANKAVSADLITGLMVQSIQKPGEDHPRYYVTVSYVSSPYGWRDWQSLPCETLHEAEELQDDIMAVIAKARACRD